MVFQAEGSIVNVSQAKMATLGLDQTPEEFVAGLAPPVRRRVEALQELQAKHDELEAQFRKERAELEAKYEKLYGATAVRSRCRSRDSTFVLQRVSRQPRIFPLRCCAAFGTIVMQLLCTWSALRLWWAPRRCRPRRASPPATVSDQAALGDLLLSRKTV